MKGPVHVERFLRSHGSACPPQSRSSSLRAVKYVDARDRRGIPIGLCPLVRLHLLVISVGVDAMFSRHDVQARGSLTAHQKKRCAKASERWRWRLNRPLPLALAAPGDVWRIGGTKPGIDGTAPASALGAHPDSGRCRRPLCSDNCCRGNCAPMHEVQQREAPYIHRSGKKGQLAHA